jgi:hypothetical protein
LLGIEDEVEKMHARGGPKKKKKEKDELL